MVMQIKRVVVVVVVVYIPGMQPRFKKTAMFQQLDSRFSAMLVLASLHSAPRGRSCKVAFLLIAILQLWAYYPSL